MTLRQTSVALGLAAWFAVALFTRTTTDSAHEWSRLGTVESLVERHTYTIEGSKFRGTRDKIYRNGHFYSHQPPLLATLQAPVYWVIHKTGLRLSNTLPVDPAYYLFVLFTSGVAFALSVVLLHRVFLALGAPPLRAAVGAFVLPFGTWVFPYSVVSSNHAMSAMLLSAFAYAMITIERTGCTPRLAALLGGSLGLMTVFEVLPVGSFLPAAAIFVWWRRARFSRRHLGIAGLTVITPLVAHVTLNVPITGDIVPGGFHVELFNFEGTTFAPGELITGAIKHRSIAALRDYTITALFTGKGYFTLAPVLVIGSLCSIGFWRWWKDCRVTQLVLMVGTVTSFAAALLMTNNFGGAAVGFRHATYLAPAFLILTAPLFVSRGRIGTVAFWTMLLVAAASAYMLRWYAVGNPWIDLHLPLDVPLIAAG